MTPVRVEPICEKHDEPISRDTPLALGVLNLQIRSGSSYTHNAMGVRETSGRFVKDTSVSDPATVFLPPAGRVCSTGHSGQSQRSDDGARQPLSCSRD